MPMVPGIRENCPSSPLAISLASWSNRTSLIHHFAAFRYYSCKARITEWRSIYHHKGLNIGEEESEDLNWLSVFTSGGQSHVTGRWLTQRRVKLAPGDRINWSFPTETDEEEKFKPKTRSKSKIDTAHWMNAMDPVVSPIPLHPINLWSRIIACRHIATHWAGVVSCWHCNDTGKIKRADHSIKQKQTGVKFLQINTEQTFL